MSGTLAAALIAFCDLRWDARICLPASAYRYSLAVGLILVMSGVVLWAEALRLIVKGIRGKRLITTGVFQYTRNPLYAAIIFLLIPGAALILQNLLFMLVSVVMVFVFKRLIVREEAALLEEYGDLYARYLKNVSQLIPRAGLW